MDNIGNNVLQLEAEIKVKQDLLNQELKSIENEVRKQREIENAIKLANERVNVWEYETKIKNSYILKAYNEGCLLTNKLKVENKDITRTQIPYYYWDGMDKVELDPIIRSINASSLFYGDYKITFNYDNKMELPGNISTSFRSYKKISTVIEKIDEYVRVQSSKKENETNMARAIKKSSEHLTKLYPHCELKYTSEWIRANYLPQGGYSKNNVVVIFPKYEVKFELGYSTDREFTLRYTNLFFKGEMKDDYSFILDSLNKI